MSDYFDLPVFAKNHEVGSRCSLFEGRGVTVASSFYANQKPAYDAMAHAINNHDRLAEENAKLREVLESIVAESEHSWIDLDACIVDAKQLLNQLKEKNNDR